MCPQCNHRTITHDNIRPRYEDRITLDKTTGSLELRVLALLTERVCNMTITPYNTDLVEFNSSVSLSCSSSASSLSYHWLNGSSEATASDGVQLVDGNSRHRYCAGLEVLPPGPVNGTLGGNVIFKTTINPTTLSTIYWTFGDPTVTIVDFLSSEGPVTRAGYVGRISLDNSTGSLELRKLTLADSGEYRVIIGESDLMQLADTSLNVYETVSGATITITPNPPIIEWGSVTLICDAAGFNITREWMKDDHPLSSGDNIIISEVKRVLSINPVKRTDSGEYMCTVRNPVSSTNANGPDGMEIKGPTEIELGQQLTLTCSADSNPPASYTWMLNGTEIPGHSPEFTKEKSKYSDSGLSTVAITGIVIIVLLVLEVAVSVAVYFIKEKGSNADPMHRGGSQQNVYENPSPVYENPSPLYENPSPVYENPSPVYENPSPVRDNTQQNLSPPLPLT
ncbi:unnamed protein product, partial [Coregonus sp. 'balchen']